MNSVLKCYRNLWKIYCIHLLSSFSSIFLSKPRVKTLPLYYESTTALYCKTKNARTLFDIIILEEFFASAFEWIAEQVF